MCHHFISNRKKILEIHFLNHLASLLSFVAKSHERSFDICGRMSKTRFRFTVRHEACWDRVTHLTWMKNEMTRHQDMFGTTKLFRKEDETHANRYQLAQNGWLILPGYKCYWTSCLYHQAFEGSYIIKALRLLSPLVIGCKMDSKRWQQPLKGRRYCRNFCMYCNVLSSNPHSNTNPNPNPNCHLPSSLRLFRAVTWRPLRQWVREFKIGR